MRLLPLLLCVCLCNTSQAAWLEGDEEAQIEAVEERRELAYTCQNSADQARISAFEMAEDAEYWLGLLEEDYMAVYSIMTPAERAVVDAAMLLCASYAETGIARFNLGLQYRENADGLMDIADEHVELEEWENAFNAYTGACEWYCTGEEDEHAEGQFEDAEDDFQDCASLASDVYTNIVYPYL